jgi:hypothetical protein
MGGTGGKTTVAADADQCHHGGADTMIVKGAVNDLDKRKLMLKSTVLASVIPPSIKRFCKYQ